jgi:putative ABC transport system permease protein
MASAQWGEEGRAVMILVGVDPDSYTSLFPGSVRLSAGSFLEPGREGIVLSIAVADMLEESAGTGIRPGDSILLTGMNQVSGMKIREVTVLGIHDYGEVSPDLSMVCFVDPETLRIMNGMVNNTAESLALTEAERSMLEPFGEEDLFGSGIVADLAECAAPVSGTASGPASADAGAGSSVRDWLGILGDVSGRENLNRTDPDAWNYLLVKTEDAAAGRRAVRQLNGFFRENGIDARAHEWMDGAGVTARMADTMKTVFNLLILIVAVVSVIIIMNTLVISVTERFGEIGTMRAIGAGRRFVSGMITLETLMITVSFGLLGIIAGVAVLLVMGAVGIQAGNQFMAILLGGPVFHPGVSAGAVLSALAAVAAIGIVSARYPVAMALRIPPLRAMNREA